jgi:hypothetical protein
VLEAVEGIIKAADPAKRQHLAATIDRYSEDCPDDFYWSISGQAPSMLVSIVLAIDVACRDEKPVRHHPKMN